MEKTKRLLTWVLAVAMVLTMALPVFAADNDGDSTGASGQGSGGTASLLDTLNSITYGEYLEKYEGMADGRGEIVINGADYFADETVLTDAHNIEHIGLLHSLCDYKRS